MKKVVFSIWGIVGLVFIAQMFISSSESEVERTKKEFTNNYKIYAFDLPENIKFANERVPMYDFEVRERLDREMLVNTYWQSQTLLFFKRANRYFPLIEKVLEKHGIPEDFKYIPLIESGFMNVVSPAGAVGYWQFLESTGEEYGLEINDYVDERYHIEKATEAACRYFNHAHDIFGNWTLAAASYNMGITGVKRSLEKQKIRSYYDLKLNPETSRYVFRLIALKEILENPRDYGFQFEQRHLYQPFETRDIEVDSTIDSWVDFSLENDVTYKILKTYNPWLRDNSLPNKSGRKYYIQLPLQGMVDTFYEVNATQFDVDTISPEAGEELIEKALPGEDYKEADFKSHKVKKGEDIYSIAEEYQVKVSEIMQWNNLSSEHVKRGQKIKILKKEIEGK